MEELPGIVVNATHMKALPGRKADEADAVGSQTCCSMDCASFIPDRKQRELREMTRYRKIRAEERAREYFGVGEPPIPAKLSQGHAKN